VRITRLEVTEEKREREEATTEMRGREREREEETETETRLLSGEKKREAAEELD